jgi:hypothetical protein
MKVKFRKRWLNTIRHDRAEPVQLIIAEGLSDLQAIIKDASEKKSRSAV